MAALAGGVLFAIVLTAGCAIVIAWKGALCNGEWRPFLGSGRQAFAIYGCLVRDAGPLIAVKKALRLYDPSWSTVIK